MQIQNRLESLDTIQEAARIKGTLYMTTAGFFFAANVLLLRAFASSDSAWLSSGLRFFVGVLICFFLANDGGHRMVLKLFTQRNLMVRGLVGGVGVVCFYAAIPGLGAGKATFIHTSYVVLGPVCALFILGEAFTVKSIVLSALALMGVFLMSGAGMSGWEMSPSFLLAMTSALLSAWAVVLIRQLSRSETSSTIYAAQCVYGLLICLVPAWLALSGVTVNQILILGLCGILAAGGQLLLTVGFRYLSVAEGCLLNLLTAVMISIGGLIWFQETYNFAEILGVIAILVSCALFNVKIPLTWNRKD